LDWCTLRRHLFQPRFTAAALQPEIESRGDTGYENNAKPEHWIFHRVMPRETAMRFRLDISVYAIATARNALVLSPHRDRRSVP